MPKALLDLRPDARVVVKRNLDHPAWMKVVPCDERDGGGNKYVRDETVEEVIGEDVILHHDRLFDLTRKDPNARVRLAGNRFWYMLSDGFQQGSGATYIVPADN